ncbi:hypothetical protein [Pseudodesulfovibrio sp. S3]|uniref:hypothetical protein n=1 Tax=Pseudodesulfovibrio sp. S3 TaxID=2283629 RepID=UPI0013E38878|nr:hypothetical protein [Pseudodesulfovibrio sp. S3]
MIVFKGNAETEGCFVNGIDCDLVGFLSALGLVLQVEGDGLGYFGRSLPAFFNGLFFAMLQRYVTSSGFFPFCGLAFAWFEKKFFESVYKAHGSPLGMQFIELWRNCMEKKRF